MSDFLETFSIKNLGVLRTTVASGAVENNDEIVPGIYLSWDEEDTEIAIAYESPDWAALSLDYTVKGAPRWLSLNLALADGRFEVGDVIGLIVEGYAAESRSITLRLRSKIEDETFDASWEETIDLHPDNGVSAALRTIEPFDGIGGREGYHTLVFGLPAKSGSMTIRAMRVFLMPGSRGLRSDSGTLSSAAD